MNPEAADHDARRRRPISYRRRQAADADPAVTLAPASLEGSNVNPVSAMVVMITNARQFQMQTKLLESADKNDQSANQLLSFS